jgi:MATE family multidrug resistance protein
MSTSATSLDWLERPQRELLRLSWPVAVSMLSYSTMTLIDALFVGRIGKDALAGLGLGGTISFTIITFGWGLGRAGKTLVSQAVGAGRREEANGYLGASLVASALFGLLAIVLSIPAAHLVGRICATPAEADAFRTYMILRSFGAPSTLLFSALREARYGTGEARSPMIASIIANACNAVLAYLFIFTLHRGVAGAAVATAIAQTIELFIMASIQRDWGLRTMRRAHVLQLFRVGTPIGLQLLLEVGAFAVLAAMIASMSAAQMAGHQITLQIISFSFMPALAIGEAGAVLVGQVVGAARDELVLPIARMTGRLVAAYTALCTVLFLAFASPLVAAFKADAETLAIGIRLVRTSTLFLVADGVNIVARSALRGTGDVKYPAWVGVISSWVMTPPLTWLLGYHFGLGAFGGWLGLSGEVFAGAAFQWLRLWKGGWKKHAERTRTEMLAATS